ncbi:MAG: Lrp/AsnC family transcriptional regulator [Spirochaetota bacterium]
MDLRYFAVALEFHMAEKLDDTDLEIIRRLWDGRTAYKDIAPQVGLTTNTVRNRVNRMLESGVLQIIGLVDPAAIEGHYSAFVGFKIVPQDMSAALDHISALQGVVAAATVSGRFDIMAVVMFNNSFSHNRFLEEEVPSIPGLLSTETLFVVGGNDFQLRYVL